MHSYRKWQQICEFSLALQAGRTWLKNYQALGSAVFGRDKADCRYVASRLVCGMVCVCVKLISVDDFC